MTIKEIMKYMESEFVIINQTPCEICGGSYFAQEMSLAFIDSLPYDVCDCVCDNCGHERIFEFSAPFVNNKPVKKFKNTLN